MDADIVLATEIKVNNKLVGIIHKNLQDHSLTFYKVTKMSMEEVKDLLNTKLHDTENKQK